MYTFVQQGGGGPPRKSMYNCAYMYVHLSLSPPSCVQILDLAKSCRSGQYLAGTGPGLELKKSGRIDRNQISVRTLDIENT